MSAKSTQADSLLYFPLTFAQEYFTLITRGQSLVHLPNMHCELLYI